MGVYAQQTGASGSADKIKGKVTDKEGEELIGVNIRIKNTMIGTVSQLDGSFELMKPIEVIDPILLFTYVGMMPLEVKYLGQPLNVVMQESIELEEVVVTGIFNKAKESYTGAVTFLSAKQLKESGTRSLVTTISNLDPSFNIAENISLGSDPNSLPSITMRGSSSMTNDVRGVQSDNSSIREANQPLFIMDGFEIGLERLNDLDENQIESITLLKDASATAMYGTRGANGVVVITTKAPIPGKLKITYKGGLNFEVPDLSSYNLLNASEKLEYEKAAGIYSATSLVVEDELLQLYNQRKTDIARGIDTYWLKYPVRAGVGSKHSLRFEGGDDVLRYALGVSYNDIQGIMKGSGRQTLNGNVFLSYTTGKFRFQNNLQIASNTSQNSPYGDFEQYGKVNSYWKPYDDNGNLVKLLESRTYGSLNVNPTSRVYNPLYDASLPIKNEGSYKEIKNDFALEYHLIPQELILRAKASIGYTTRRSDIYYPAQHTMFDTYLEEDYKRKGTYTYIPEESTQFDGDVTAVYTKTYNEKHQITSGVSFNLQETSGERFSITGEGITSSNFDFLGMATQYKDEPPQGSESIARNIGGLFNANYIYDRRYFVDVTGKLEGSSRFGANNKTAPFWSVGAGWNIYNEAFFQENEIVDIARLRVSYGTSGSQKFNPYQAMTTYRTVLNSNYNTWYGVYLLGLGNPNLGWQETRQVNIGTEIEMFKNKLRLMVDVYDKLTNDLLADISIPSSAGFTTYKDNVGKISNKGIETSAVAHLLRKKQVHWSVGFSLVHNKNEIKEISDGLEALNDEINAEKSSNPSFLYKEGQSMSTIFAVKSNGIDPSNGKEIFVKKDGSLTYEWDASDKVACGDSEAKFKGNINTNLRYKDFTLNIIFAYRWGGQTYNYTLINKVENIMPYNNADKRVLYDRWKQPGDLALFKSVDDFSPTYASSRFVMDDNILDCRNISLTYDVPMAWVNRYVKGIQYLSVTANTEDVFHFSTVKQERGLLYPYAKKYSLSLTARF